MNILVGEIEFAGQRIVTKNPFWVNNQNTLFLSWKDFMNLREIVQFVEGTADAAFAVDGFGNISAWNATAAQIIGISAAEAVGKSPSRVIRGMDEGGAICFDDCIVKQSANSRRPMHNFDLRIETPEARKWFNISVVVVESIGSVHPYTVHILRQVDVNKRLEMLLRDFVIGETNMPEEEVNAFISSTRSVIQDKLLTQREIEILRLVARGKKIFSHCQPPSYQSDHRRQSPAAHS